MEFFKNKKEKGFTLSEILVVIGILAVLTSITIPLFRNFHPTLQLSGTARDLIADLRYIQQFTITEQDEYCIKFFEEDKKYQIMKCEGETLLEEKFLPDEILTVTVSGFADDMVRYNPYGAAVESGTIMLENTKGEIKTIEVKVSGFVKIIN